MESFYKTSVVALSLVLAMTSALQDRESEQALYDDMNDALGAYYYYDYGYYGGQTVVAIIFLDVLLPLCICILVVMCIVRACRRRHHGGHHEPAHYNPHHVDPHHYEG